MLKAARGHFLPLLFLLVLSRDLTVTVPTPVVEGDKVKLGCTQSCLLKEKPKVIWRKDGNSIALKQYENSELILQSVSPKDEGDYSCALQGHEGHPSEPKKLNIMFSPKNTSVSVSPVVITNGTTVTLTCSSDANPPVENYTWFKVNQSTPVESGQQYSISNIRSEDGGQYYCEARNKYGAENSSAVSITVVSITVLGGNSYGMLAVVGATACAAVGVILAVVCVRYQMNRNQRNEQMNRPNSRRRDEQATHDYENDHQGKNNDDIQMNSVYQSLNPNTTQPDAVYQSLNPNTTQPDAVYQTLNPNTTQADAVYQSLNPNTTQADAVYQSLNPNTS